MRSAEGKDEKTITHRSPSSVMREISPTDLKFSPSSAFFENNQGLILLSSDDKEKPARVLVHVRGKPSVHEAKPFYSTYRTQPNAEDHNLIFALLEKRTSDEKVLKNLIEDFFLPRPVSTNWQIQNVIIKTIDHDFFVHDDGDSVPLKWKERTIRERKFRQNTDGLTVLKIALFCCEPAVSLMIMQAIKNVKYCESVIPLLMKENSRAEKVDLLHQYYSEIEYTTQDYIPRLDLHTEKDIHPRDTREHHVRRRDPIIRKNSVCKIPKIRNANEAVYLLEKHLLTLDPSYSMNYKKCCDCDVTAMLEAYWHQQIRQVKTLQELNAVYHAGAFAPFINRDDSCLAKVFCCFFCKGENLYPSAKIEFITLLQARAVEMVKSISSSTAEKIDESLLASLFDETHFKFGVKRQYQQLLQSESKYEVAPVLHRTAKVAPLP